MTTNIHKCKKPWNDLIILPIGNCINCLFQDRNYHLGNVNDQSVKYVWNSDTLRDNREKMLNGEIPDICKTGINKCEYLK